MNIITQKTRVYIVLQGEMDICILIIGWWLQKTLIEYKMDIQNIVIFYKPSVGN